MKNAPTLGLIGLLACMQIVSAQTFSIVAVDIETGEVGAAGGSCFPISLFDDLEDDFISELFPGVGAINTQLFYSPTNQATARDRMNMGDTPQEIIDFLVANDVSGEPDRRQYGIVRLIDNGAQSAAFSGDPVTDFIGHITGGNYAIQGNGLLSEEIIQDMETGFLEAAGDLACRLMAALQGANVVGADTRCVANGTSSLFAFLKVAQPDDEFGNPSLLVSTRSEDGDGVEPIDVVQELFDEEKSCVTTSTDDVANFDLHFSVFPNPSSEFLRIEQGKSGNYQVELLDIFGNLIKTSEMTEDFDMSFLPQGTYLIRLSNKEKTYSKFSIT